MNTEIRNTWIIATLVALVAGGFLLVCRAQKPTDNIVRLKEKVESCKMLTVVQDEAGYGIEVPDFFQEVPTDERATMRFRHIDPQTGVQLGMVAYLEFCPGCTVDGELEALAQDLQERGYGKMFSVEKGEEYFFVESPMFPPSNPAAGHVDCEKTYIYGELGVAISLHFYYPPAYRSAVDRIIASVKAWEPYEE
ncbi:MAG: hypothetical protein IJ722_00660 [Alloprevotella sp.]|nr:hypothetical protein [Alloprevotella sp.]